MELLLNLAYCAGGVAGLYYGAEFLVKGGSSVARKAGVSSLVIGLTLVAFATSAPELVVSVKSALNGNADISLGNVVGSNICNIALILGVCACITPLNVQKQLLKFDVHVMVGSALLLAVFYYFNHGLGRIAGLIFFAGFLAYIFWNIYASRKENKVESAVETHSQDLAEETKVNPPVKENLFIAIFLVILGLVFLVAGADFFLKSAIYFAKLFKLSDAVIGLTIVAVGTSLPELATSIVAACKKESDIAIGNVVGSNIFNILGILGIAPLIRPIQNASLDLMDMGTMLFVTLLLWPMMRTNWKLSRKEGAFLLLSYILYIVYLLRHHV